MRGKMATCRESHQISEVLKVMGARTLTVKIQRRKNLEYTLWYPTDRELGHHCELMGKHIDRCRGAGVNVCTCAGVYMHTYTPLFCPLRDPRAGDTFVATSTHGQILVSKYHSPWRNG